LSTLSLIDHLTTFQIKGQWCFSLTFITAFTRMLCTIVWTASRRLM